VTPEAAIVEGAVAFALDGAAAPDRDREGLVVEIARHLRNARVIQRALRQQKVFAEVFARSADALFVTDAEGRVLSWNDAAEELFGWSASEIVGRHGEALVPAARRDELLALLARVEREGQVAAVETERLRRDGTTVAVEGSFAALRDPDGRFVGVFRSYRDITRRKEVERMKSEFVSLVSHELRTPLTAIRGFAETIVEAWEDLPEDKRKQYLGIMLDESKRLSQMVTDFLDIARLEAGGIETMVAPVSTKALFSRAAKLFEKNASGAAFELDIASGAEEFRGDEEQLYRLLVNLSANALKYTPAGGTVRLEARRDGDFVELSVRDQGPGVAKKDRARLFEKFYRAGDAVSKKTPGTGLGLAICKGIVENHRGTIRVDDAPGGGARFTARLPAAGPAPEPGR
jgi:PAS domain S-box-containing protein